MDESYKSAPPPKVGASVTKRHCCSKFKGEFLPLLHKRTHTLTHTVKDTKTLKRKRIKKRKPTSNPRVEEWGGQPIMLAVVRALAVTLYLKKYIQVNS